MDIKRLGLLEGLCDSDASWAQKQNMPDYENLSDLPPDKAIDRSRDILKNGWGHGNKYEKISLFRPIPWDEDGDDRRSWNFHVQSWDMCSDLLHAHSETGDEESYNRSLKIALEWLEHNPERNISCRSKFTWYDMAVGMRAYRLAYILDVARRRHDVSDNIISSLWLGLQLHAEYLADDANICFHNNHGFYQVAGQLAMGRRFMAESEAMESAYRLGRERLLRMMRRQFTEEGVHAEHSPDYHRMVYGSLKGIISSRLVDDCEIIDAVNNIENSLAWFVTPQQTLVNFGDTDIRSIGRSPREALRKWNAPSMRFMVSGGRVGSPEEKTVHAFEKSGYFVARSDWRASTCGQLGGSYLAQTAAFHSRTHKHADDLSFVWFEHGQAILVDAGRYGYLGRAEPGSELFNDGYWYSDPNRVFCESTRAHNTVEIDGRNYQRKGVVPYGSGIRRWGQGKDGMSWCETSVTQFGVIDHNRVLVFMPGQWLLVSDRLHDRTGASHQFLQWMHFDSAFDVCRSGDGFKARSATLPVAVQVIPLDGTATASDVVLAQPEPDIQGFISPTANTMLPAPAVNFSASGSSRHMVTLLALSDEAVSPVSFDQGDGQWSVAWEKDGKRTLVSFSDSGVFVQQQ